jgi:hypothetical protein
MFFYNTVAIQVYKKLIINYISMIILVIIL